jgi:tetratricopeptide (TPR) repeat protein
MLSVTGRSQEAIAEGSRAVELDPLSLIINALNGYHLHLARRDDEAIARLKKTLELDSSFWIAHQFLGMAYIEKKMYPEAISEFSQAVKSSGDTAKGRAVLQELKSLESQRYVPPSNLALLSYVLGEKDEAFSWLEKAYQDRDIRLCRLKVDSKWDSMRSEPRFVEILKRIGLQ